MNGRDIEVPDEGASLLDVLRERLGLKSAKDGCSPQGQCGCCTVLVDGAPRVACVTPARRVAGRDITTLEGLATADRWATAFAATGASQCGFCTPGIIMRLSALPDPTNTRAVEQALLAHLCRCTGWRTILGTAPDADTPAATHNLVADRRAALEGHNPQRTGPQTAKGEGGFADDTAPADALVAVPDNQGGWAVGESLHEARAKAGKVQGRRSGGRITHPIDVPPGDWLRTLRTTWVEPAYLEPDASWCRPGEDPHTPLANGGAFGGKVESDAPGAAKQLADKYKRPVRVVYSREDTIRRGPKRPPIAAGITQDGTGTIRVARTAGIADAIHAYAPHLAVEEVDVSGPRTSAALRAAGWAEAAVLLQPETVIAPNGASASAAVNQDHITVRVSCGDPLDATTLRSYCIGAAHMALGWVTSEAIAVDDDGEPQDLTIRSFGILRAKDMPAVDVVIEPSESEPVNGSDAVFAAVAAAAWQTSGYGQDWPTNRGGRQ